MGRLLDFLYAYGNFFFFLLFQLAGATLLFSFNSRQQQVFQEALLNISGRVSVVNARFTAYFHLAEQNEKLVQENLILHKALLAHETILGTYQNRIPLTHRFSTLPDSLLPLYRYRFIPCRTINNSTTGSFNFILLNVGARQGVKKGMGLISSEGAAGEVVSVSRNFALAQSLLNENFQMSVKVRKKEVFGTLRWDAKDPTISKVDFIPLHFPIAPGDTVVSSGYGTIFPENIVVGIVLSVKPDVKGGFHNIQVKLSTDFRRLDYLYLVEREQRGEIDSLTKPFTDRQLKPGSRTIPAPHKP